ncbi:hypothetical protein MTO96_007129 [Rhipicephalus appendiculatus]
MVTTVDITSPFFDGAKIRDKSEAPYKRGPEIQRWRWTPEKVYHWVVSFGVTIYVFWRFATTEQNAYILEQMPESFANGSYGFERKQTTKYLVITAWKWYLLHPVLARMTAYAAPSLMPVFYVTYSLLFVTFNFGWEVTLLFLGQHAVFYVTASLRSAALCYVVAAMIHLQKFYLPFDPYDYMYPKYGHMPYGAAFVAFHWNVLRGLSFSVDCVRSEQRRNTGGSKRRWPPYWKTLGYLMYMPMLYLGPPTGLRRLRGPVGEAQTELYAP